jgi:peptidoglycan/xylan/chitin deacetylase (PgdA/CDA1 family)
MRLVSFCFDDFPSSAYAIGGTVLRRHGVRGTYYASLGLLGKDSKMGPLFTMTDIANLISEGHELGCHTFDHLRALSTTAGQYEQSLQKNRDQFRALFPSYELKTFAYPYGNVTLRAKRIASRHYACSRGVAGRVNSGTIDLNLLSAIRLYTGIFDWRWIENALENLDGWLIFYTHDVQERPSRFGCSILGFEKVLQKSLRTGAKVLPVREALAIIQNA